MSQPNQQPRRDGYPQRRHDRSHRSPYLDAHPRQSRHYEHTDRDGTYQSYRPSYNNQRPVNGRPSFIRNATPARQARSQNRWAEHIARLQSAAQRPTPPTASTPVNPASTPPVQSAAQIPAPPAPASTPVNPASGQIVQSAVQSPTPPVQTSTPVIPASTPPVQSAAQIPAPPVPALDATIPVADGSGQTIWHLWQPSLPTPPVNPAYVPLPGLTRDSRQDVYSAIEHLFKFLFPSGAGVPCKEVAEQLQKYYPQLHRQDSSAAYSAWTSKAIRDTPHIGKVLGRTEKPIHYIHNPPSRSPVQLAPRPPVQLAPRPPVQLAPRLPVQLAPLAPAQDRAHDGSLIDFSYLVPIRPSEVSLRHFAGSDAPGLTTVEPTAIYLYYSRSTNYRYATFAEAVRENHAASAQFAHAWENHLNTINVLFAAPGRPPPENIFALHVQADASNSWPARGTSSNGFQAAHDLFSSLPAGSHVHIMARGADCLPLERYGLRDLFLCYPSITFHVRIYQSNTGLLKYTAAILLEDNLTIDAMRDMFLVQLRLALSRYSTIGQIPSTTLTFEFTSHEYLAEVRQPQHRAGSFIADWLHAQAGMSSLRKSRPQRRVNNNRNQVPDSVRALFQVQEHQLITLRSKLMIHLVILSKTDDESLKLLRHLCETQPDCINYKSANGLTPLLVAFGLQRVEMAKILIEAGADQTVRNHNNDNLVHFALRTSKTDETGRANLRQLLELVDKRLIAGMFTERATAAPGAATPLAHWILVRLQANIGRFPYNFQQNEVNPTVVEQEHVMRMILEFSKGEDLGLVNGEGDTPLHAVVRYGAYHLLRIMLECRPDLLFRENASGRTPYEMAEDAQLANNVFNNPPSLAVQTYGHRYYGQPASSAIIHKSPERFIKKDSQTNVKQQTWNVCLEFKERMGAGKKRKLVSLLEANEVAKRLAGKKQKVRRHSDEEDAQDENSKRDEVDIWFNMGLSA
ncbi:hypothetical protein C7974DRAFT_458783 [Boeremia exigua]|uniref:uncharacterized protein n=1 Tax=Boeremia exigua TaxID=749465 RepID=UPI001E8DE801|nr:uncharacterized protein C7974DRAFT_458783 [Boeremia exigua]KAH6620539.1 hypothetical protein C7974DRAFT_458783 [Boeremia exigua]